MPGPTSRRDFLARSGVAALGLSGVYGLIDGLVAAPARAAAPAKTALPAEQHLLLRDRLTVDTGVEIAIPPLHHLVVTARLRRSLRRAELNEARKELEHRLKALERRFAPTAGGLAVTVAWGLPYFRTFLPQLADGRRFPGYLPLDLRASQGAGRPVHALIDAIRFPSDPDSVVLEQNDLVVQFRSDKLANLEEASSTVFDDLRSVLALTSVRRGFLGVSATNGRSLPRELALAAGVADAEAIPANAPLFLGFTSTNHDALGPRTIANLETLPGMTDQWPDGYFANGTTLHLSHLREDLFTWYRRAYPRRIWAMYDPERAAELVNVDTVTLPVDVLLTKERIFQFAQGGVRGITGHGSNMHPENRLQADVTDNYGDHLAAGTAILQRVDFNTLDNPFAWTSRPTVDRFSEEPAPGLHFLSYAPTNDTFHRIRLAMDGFYQDGSVVPIPPRSIDNGLNGVLETTHRQNFIVPPRRHRSFPLAELL